MDDRDVSALVSAMAVILAGAVILWGLVVPLVLGCFARRP